MNGNDERTGGGLPHIPDAELDVMLALWRCEPPATTAKIALLLPEDRQWKTPTLLSFLTRLEKRGFLTAEKRGREYVWTPLVMREDYVPALTRDFFERVHGGSVGSLMKALEEDGTIPGEILDGLLAWLEERS